MLEPWIAQDNGTVRSFVDGLVRPFGKSRTWVPDDGGGEPGGPDPFTVTYRGRLPGGTLPGGNVMNEASGGADSRIHPNTWWTHEDSGGTFIYALGYNPVGSDSNVPCLKVFDLNGVEVTAGQWEDMTYDQYNGRRKMWVANCGGNTPVNSFKAFYFNEPTDLSDPETVGSISVTTYYFKYPGTEKYDCETMMCDPLTGRVYFLTKEAIGTAQVYAAPADLVARTAGGNQINQLTRLTSGNFTKAGNLTGGDFNPSGTKFYVANNGSRGFWYTVVRNSSNVITGFTYGGEFFIPEPETTATPPTSPSAETLFVRADGSALIRNSEGGQTQIISLALAA